MQICGYGDKSDSKIDRSVSDFKEGGHQEFKLIII
jgi:hypothetical protein